MWELFLDSYTPTNSSFLDNLVQIKQACHAMPHNIYFITNRRRIFIIGNSVYLVCIYLHEMLIESRHDEPAKLGFILYSSVPLRYLEFLCITVMYTDTCSDDDLVPIG